MTSLFVVPDKLTRDETATSHVASDRMAAFLDGRLSGANRDETVTHFAECDECRRELAELRTMLETSRVARRRTWIGGAAALAAALAFAIAPRVRDIVMRGEGETTTTDIVRSSDTETRLSLLRPRDEESVERSDLTLTWQSIATGLEYGVVVQDTAGTIIWRDELPDTIAIVPDTARLESGRRYHWSVEARLPNGRTAKTTHQFTIR